MYKRCRIRQFTLTSLSCPSPSLLSKILFFRGRNMTLVHPGENFLCLVSSSYQPFFLKTLNRALALGLSRLESPTHALFSLLSLLLLLFWASSLTPKYESSPSLIDSQFSAYVRIVILTRPRCHRRCGFCRRRRCCCCCFYVAAAIRESST